MRDAYPYSELEIFVAGYDRGWAFARGCPRGASHDYVMAEELASRSLSMFDVPTEGLLMLGMRTHFVPREIFDAGVRRGLASVPRLERLNPGAELPRQDLHSVEAEGNGPHGASLHHLKM